MTQPRILFAGTPEISVPLLKALAARFVVAGVLTSCDKSSGRSSRPVPSPVKAAALELGLPVLQFDSIRTEARVAVGALGADTLVSFAFGKIFGPRFLALFPNGKFNVHPSDLPAYRGPSPVQSTIMHGLEQATVSFQTLGPGMDEGGIWGKTVIPLAGTETTQSLSDMVARRAAEFVPELLSRIVGGSVSSVPQSGEVSYCSMIGRETGKLDFSRTVREVHCLVRACYPWPKAWARADGNDIAVTGVWGGFSDIANPDGTDAAPGTVVAFRKDRGIGVACADGILWITGLQLPAKKELDFRSFVNGNRWILSARFD